MSRVVGRSTRRPDRAESYAREDLDTVAIYDAQSAAYRRAHPLPVHASCSTHRVSGHDPACLWCQWFDTGTGIHPDVIRKAVRFASAAWDVQQHNFR